MAIVLGSTFGHVPAYPLKPRIITGKRAAQAQALGGRPDLVPEHQQGSYEHAAALEAQRNADMVNRHLQFQDMQLSMADQKRMQKLSNGMAAIQEAEKNGTLTPQEANHLRFQIKTEIDPMKLKMAQAQVAHINMQTDMLGKQAEAQALANVQAKKMAATSGPDGFFTHNGKDYFINHKGEPVPAEKGKELTWAEALKQGMAEAQTTMPGHYDPNYKPAIDPATGKPKAGEAMDRIQNDLKRQHHETANAIARYNMGKRQAPPLAANLPEAPEERADLESPGVAGVVAQPPAQPPQNAPPATAGQGAVGPFGGSMADFLQQNAEAIANPPPATAVERARTAVQGFQYTKPPAPEAPPITEQDLGSYNYWF